MSACEKGRRVKVEAVSEVARSVRDSLGPPPLGDAFDAFVVKEGVDFVGSAS